MFVCVGICWFESFGRKMSVCKDAPILRINLTLQNVEFYWVLQQSLLLKKLRIKRYIYIFYALGASNIARKTFASSRCSLFKMEFGMRKYQGYSVLRHNVVWTHLQTHTYVGYIFKSRSLINTPSAVLKRSSVRFKTIFRRKFCY